MEFFVGYRFLSFEKWQVKETTFLKTIKKIDYQFSIQFFLFFSLLFLTRFLLKYRSLPIPMKNWKQTIIDYQSTHSVFWFLFAFSFSFLFFFFSLFILLVMIIMNINGSARPIVFFIVFKIQIKQSSCLVILYCSLLNICYERKETILERMFRIFSSILLVRIRNIRLHYVA